MKKNYLYIMVAGAVIAVLAGCSKENNSSEDPSTKGTRTETIRLAMENDTKVTLETTSFAWEDGDAIAVWTGTADDNGSYQSCSVLDNSITVILDEGATRRNYAVYPSSVKDDANYGQSTLKVNLPSSYDYADVSGIKTPVPMVAANTAENNLTFYSVGAIVRLAVNGIPNTANKLEVTFDKDVTGSFEVSGPETTSPAISTSTNTGENVVTINLTAGNDYSGAVINIPVPTGALSVSSVVAKNDDAVITTAVGSGKIFTIGWEASRAHGKKATAAFTPSFGSIIVAPGNLYTEGGTLKMASNYYDYVYNASAENDFKEATYNTANRTHFNFNEAYHLMHGTAPSELTYTLATTDEIGDRPAMVKSDIVGGDSKAWYIPDYKELWDLTGYESGSSVFQKVRPGAKVRNGDSGEYTTGWMWVKVLVSGMGDKGISSSDGTAESLASNYQAGLLLFPDNMEITGTFGSLGTQNSASSAFNTTTLTKGNLDALITAGCAFLPAAGRYSTSYNNWSGVGTVGSIFNCYRINYIPWSYFINFSNSEVRFYDSNIKATTFRNVRLVRNLVSEEGTGRGEDFSWDL